MQKQKGFIVPAVIAVVVVVILGTAGYFVYKQYSVPKPIACTQEAKLCTDGSYVSRTGPNCEFAECPETPDQTAGWKTYTNDSAGYEVKYPPNWMVYDEIFSSPIVSFCGPDYKTKEDCRMAGKGGTPAIRLRNDSLDIFAPGFCANNPNNIFCGQNIVKSNKNIAGETGLIIEFKDVNGGSIFALWKQNLQDISMFELQTSGLKITPSYRDVFNKMLSTFKFIENSDKPAIKSISPAYGPAGTKVEVSGNNFAGFEGDLNLWVESQNGIKGIIRGETGSNNNLIKFTLPPSVCQQDTSYSGLPCPAQLTLIPGVYKIYAAPWGVKSNIVNFEIK